MSLLFFLPFLTAAADDAANAYVYQMEKRIMAAWHLPKGSAGLTVALRMNFERSGRLSAVRVEQSSGNKDFDESAVEAVRRVAEFPPVPHALDHLIGDLSLCSIRRPRNRRRKRRSHRASLRRRGHSIRTARVKHKNNFFNRMDLKEAAQIFKRAAE